MISSLQVKQSQWHVALEQSRQARFPGASASGASSVGVACVRWPPPPTIGVPSLEEGWVGVQGGSKGEWGGGAEGVTESRFEERGDEAEHEAQRQRLD